ncbi:MAG TPA: hypothetical protein DHW42_02975 [Candidatus Marinimicrobia bacterium]|nr:hypothetical protein [Candidatus Neomarinimicrobiota bacterium]
MNRSAKIFKTIAVILALVLSICFAYNYLFIHIHVLEDGYVVVHSHPINDPVSRPSQANHSHSRSEIQFIHALNNVINYLIIFCLFGIIIKKILIGKFKVPLINYNYCSKFQIYLRAPPNFIY